MKKPLIGVMPLWDEKKDSLWMLPGYMDGITQAGGIPVMLPITKDENELAQLISTFDRFLILFVEIFLLKNILLLFPYKTPFLYSTPFL